MDVQEMIASGEPFAKIARSLGSRNEAISRISSYAVESYQEGSLRSDCEGCCLGRANVETKMTWRCIMGTNVSMSPLQVAALALGSVCVTVNTRTVKFVTHHSFCDQCRRSIKRNWIFAGLGQLLIGLVMGVSIIAFVYATLTLAMYSDQVGIKTHSLVACGSAIVVILSFATMRAADYWPVRGRFAHLGKSPFIFDGFE